MLDVRLAREDDRAALAAMGQATHDELFPHLAYAPARIQSLIDRHLQDDWPVIMVVTEDDTPIGFFVAVKGDYFSCDGFFISQGVFYVRPDKRGTRAAATLFRRFVRWAESFNPEEIYAGIGRGRRSEVAARFLRGFGFEPSGQVIMRRVVGGVQ